MFYILKHGEGMVGICRMVDIPVVLIDKIDQTTDKFKGSADKIKQAIDKTGRATSIPRTRTSRRPKNTYCSFLK
ncbi:hypothetical protein JOC86_004531 [Bacillus pakistanensis]|uniref:Uncharacterized protein n=1 Tax=Rossellomorea pakistanensis TaxID=992288 RepID=A0ABS2NJB8_9BACI|nr:hypothetical protein [Bacillus pakistanensis]MBM7587956.1 hypothetical protein [Bacillus pakistanensis]